jgi:hypothetical protein
MVQEYKNWAVEGVVVKAEWVDAGFNVCPKCAENNGKIFELSEIEGLIPLHPNCRCIALPTMPEKGVKTVEKVSQMDSDLIYTSDEFYKAKNFVSNKEYELTISGGLTGTRFSVLKEMDDEALKWYEGLSIRSGENRLKEGLTEKYYKELKLIQNNDSLIMERDAKFYFGVNDKGLNYINDITDKNIFELRGNRYAALNSERALDYANIGKEDAGAIFELFVKKGQKSTFANVFDLPEAVFQPGAKYKILEKSSKQFTLKNGKVVKIPYYKVELINDGSTFVKKIINKVEEIDNLLKNK